MRGRVLVFIDGVHGRRSDASIRDTSQSMNDTCRTQCDLVLVINVVWMFLFVAVFIYYVINTMLFYRVLRPQCL